MKNQTWMLGLLTVVAVVISLPGRSHADTATIQESTQNSIITGDGNYVRQHSVQINVDNASRRGSNRGTVQRSNQTADVQGRNNDSVQSNQQVNVENGRENGRANGRFRRR